MNGPFVIISTSSIKPGMAGAYAEWCATFFRDVEEAEPRLLAFNQYASSDHASAVVIQVHPDAESFEYHLKLLGERVRETFEYLDLESVQVYGPPSPFVEEFVTHGLEGVPVSVHPVHQLGFTRLGS